MNVLVLVSGLPPERIGGAERQACHVARHLASNHHVTVLTRTATVPNELATTSRCRVVQRCRVNTAGLRFAADIARTLACIGKSSTTYDVIVAYQTVIDGLIGVMARIAFGIPVIVSVRCDVEYQLDRFAQSRWLTPFVFRHADRIGVQSPLLGQQLMDTFARARQRPGRDELQSKLMLLPNGISLAPEQRHAGEGVLFVGRLTNQKGVDVLIDAMRQCPEERLTIVGDGPERLPLEQRARGLANIAFVGSVPHADVKSYLQGTRMLVVPSRNEGQPNIVMEAMAAGVPVIATRVGGIPDLIVDGESGLLVDSADSAGLVRAIRALSVHSELGWRLAATARNEIRRYEWTAVMAELERNLMEVASTGRHRREPWRQRTSSP